MKVKKVVMLIMCLLFVFGVISTAVALPVQDDFDKYMQKSQPQLYDEFKQFENDEKVADPILIGLIVLGGLCWIFKSLIKYTLAVWVVVIIIVLVRYGHILG